MKFDEFGHIIYEHYLDDDEEEILNAYDGDTHKEATPSAVGISFSSNALRSEKKLPYWRFPRRAMQEWAKRFRKGEKYDDACNITHNWKLAIDSTDVEFVRQFFNHAVEHIWNAKELASVGPHMPDNEGEDMFDHLGAALWNIASLIEYLDKNPKLTCKALSQQPEAINAPSTNA